ncbi:MAG: ABC-F family ATP-binding cassette domain-containing protein [Sphingosinicella sp.]
MAAPVLSYENLGLVQGGGWLFRGLDLHIGGRDRLALIGRNGAGKTTLLKCLAGAIDPDEGRRTLKPGLRIALFEQDPPVASFASLRDFVLAGAHAPTPHEAESLAHQIGLDLARPGDAASGGEQRRAAIARALAGAPQLLLLDEPTNHLDIAGIEWLEDWLQRFPGAFIAISHDREFLKRLTRQSLWLDRGTLRRAEIGYGGFEAWTEKVYEEEAQAAEKLDAKLALELHWLQRGVTARRRRNQGRLRRLEAMRAQRAAMLGPAGTARLAVESDQTRAKMVIEAERVSKSFGARPIVRDFSLRIQRGDRIGIVGANGTGKTTLLRLLTGELKPDQGAVTRARTLAGIVIDQQRKLLDPDKRVRDILAEGGDWIDVRGTRKHVQGYLKDFLFDPKLVDTRIGALSGGERSRLLLAREFARRSNLLVLDEPTNDLDMETLDLLQEVIADYDGTVLIVSHDRDFLDRTVTITLGLDGSARVDIVAGGYADWERKRRRAGTRARPEVRNQPARPAVVARSRTKLSYKDQRDYERLPARIDALDEELLRLESELNDPDLYRRDPARMAALGEAIARAKAEHEQSEERWLALAEEIEALAR